MNEFRKWYEEVELDADNDFDRIYDLYTGIRNRSSDNGSLFAISPFGESGLAIESSEYEYPTIVLENEAAIKGAIEFLDGLYPEGGGVLGEDTRRNNMERED